MTAKQLAIERGAMILESRRQSASTSHAGGLQWEAVSARPAQQDLPKESTSSRAFIPTATKAHKRAKSSITLRSRNRKRVVATIDAQPMLQKSECASSQLRQPPSCEKPHGRLVSEEQAPVQGLVGTSIRPSSNPNLKGSDVRLRSTQARSRQVTDKEVEVTARSSKSPSRRSRSKPASREAKSKAPSRSTHTKDREKGKRETPRRPLTEHSPAFDVIYQYEQHSHFLQQLENFPNSTGTPADENEGRSNEPSR